MKMKIILRIFAFACVVLATSCEIDNYDGPDATITGKFLDSETGELVGTDIRDGNEIGVYELGWTSESRQTWYVTNTGEYTNNLVFASTYRLEFTNCNFYPFVVNDFVLNAGDNMHDFTVTPFIRIKNPSITYDSATKTVKATFNVEAGGNDVTLSEIRLFAFTDMWVGNYIKFGITNEDCYKKVSSEAISSEINPSTQYELTINVDDNASSFEYTRNYYFRIGALANVPDVGTVRYNYSPLEVINIAR